MSKHLRIELIIEKMAHKRACRVLESSGMTGYTVVPAMAGFGGSKRWSRDTDISASGDMVVVISIGDEDKVRAEATRRAREETDKKLVDALIEAGIGRVVVPLEDPHERVRGRGLQRLREAGVEVESGLLAEQAEDLNPGFLKRMRTGRPWLRVKSAVSLDGRTGLASGESQWITGPAARHDVQRLRARSGAILTGIGTVLADDPSLNVRDDAIDTRGRQPLRVVVDSRLRTPLAAAMLALPGILAARLRRTLTARSAIGIAIGVFVTGFSSILTGLNFIVTIHKMRAPGMRWFRLPLFVWAHYATGLIMILGTPVLAIAIVVDDGTATHVAVEAPGQFEVSKAESVLSAL